MPRKLYDIDVDEITICASAASRKQFFIKKSKEKSMDNFVEIFKRFVVDEEDDELTAEEIAKAEALGKEVQATIGNAVNTFAEYKESMPEDLLEATKILVKQATFVDVVSKEDLEKAGAALSKQTRAQLTKVLEFLKGSPQAIILLKTLLGQKVEKESSEDDETKENLSEDTKAKLEKLKEFETQKAEDDKKAADKKTEENLESLVDKKLEELGVKSKPVKKSVDDEDEAGAGDDKNKKKKLKKKEGEDEEDHYPSIIIPGLTE